MKKIAQNEEKQLVGKITKEDEKLPLPYNNTTNEIKNSVNDGEFLKKKISESPTVKLLIQPIQTEEKKNVEQLKEESDKEEIEIVSQSEIPEHVPRDDIYDIPIVRPPSPPNIEISRHRTEMNTSRNVTPKQRKIISVQPENTEIMSKDFTPKKRKIEERCNEIKEEDITPKKRRKVNAGQDDFSSQPSSRVPYMDFEDICTNCLSEKKYAGITDIITYLSVHCPVIFKDFTPEERYREIYFLLKNSKKF